MKKLFTLICFFVSFGLSNAQQASDYFPSQTGFKWNFKVTPLDSASNPATSLAVFQVDSFASVANYKGNMANIVVTKTGPLVSIQQQAFLDSLFYNTSGSDGFEYLSTKNIEAFLITLDEQGVIPNFSFVNFFASLQNWYSTYRFASDVNIEYTILQKDTTISILFSGLHINIPIQFKHLGKRLQDQNIQTVLGNFDCKKFILQWKMSSEPLGGDLITLNDTIWIALGNWIVQDIMPGQYVNVPVLTNLGVSPFAIPGLETKLTDALVTVENEKEIPTSAFLEQNYPNPFNPITKISWQSPVSGWQTLKVYDVLGNEVATLVDEFKPAGRYEVEFNTSTIKYQSSSGVYFYRLHAGNFVETKKMVILK